MTSSRVRLVPALALVATCAVSPFTRAQDPSQAEAVAQLKSAITQIISSSVLASSRAGVAVMSLDTGQVLFTHNPDDLLNPASNVKLYTTAAAMARLGPEYRFDTEFYVGPRSEAGIARGLFVKGKGDPSLMTEQLWEIAGEIRHQGIRTIQGDLVLDDGYFDDQRVGPGFDEEHGDRPYLAPQDALSLNCNAVAIHVGAGMKEGERGRVELEPESDFFKIDNRTVTVRPRARRRVSPKSLPAENGRSQTIVVDGRLPLGSRDQVFYKKIDNPPFYFGFTLKRILEARGVKITGRVRRAPVPDGAKLLLVHESESLDEIVRQVNKHSNNFMAEQLLKTLGAEVKGPPGTWPKGVEAVEDFLADLGLPRGSYVMKNGSGLNDSNRFSARQTVILLREMWKRFPLMPEYVAALPVAGRDGTIRWRMEGTEAVGHLRAKTGTLDEVTSLSGYVETRGHQHLAFSVLVNDYPGRHRDVVQAIDAVGSALAATGGAASEMGAAVAMIRPSETGLTAVSTAADLEAHVASYYRLGVATDPRNLPFLRTALRTEQDPVLRMAVAEAIYLSDPDSDTAQRTFLENLSLDPQSFARLGALAGKLPVADPVVGSIADLAAQGNGDALLRLIEIAPLAAGEPGLSETFPDTLAEVARTAPSELLAAFRAAPPSAADPALTALGHGLARARDPGHPFPAEVKKAAAGANAELSGFAKQLAAMLEDRIRSAGAPQKAAPTAVAPLPAASMSESGKGGR